MKKFLRVILILSCIFLCTQRIRADRQGLQNIDFFVDKAIHDHEDCFEGKTFMNYDLLGISINDDGNFEYYVIANGQGYYVDERGNLNSSCRFIGTPIAIELSETKTGYVLVDYKNPKNYLKEDKQIRQIFSENAYKNYKARLNSNLGEDLDALRDAEKYFGVKLEETGNFDCKFCGITRYFANKFINNNGDYRELYSSEPIEKKRFIFNSDGTLQRMGGNDGSFSWHFGKNDSTIIIKDSNNTGFIERFIIEELKDNEMVFFIESIQI